MRGRESGRAGEGAGASMGECCEAISRCWNLRLKITVQIGQQGFHFHMTRLIHMTRLSRLQFASEPKHAD